MKIFNIIFILFAALSTAIGQNRATATAEYKFALNQSDLISQLNTLQNEKSSTSAIQVTLPTPEGKLKNFNVIETPVMPASLSAKYSEIKTYSGAGNENPSERISITKIRNNVMISLLLEDGTVEIEPVPNSRYFRSVYEPKVENLNSDIYVPDSNLKPEELFASDCIGAAEPCFPIGDSLYVYRIGMILSKEANAKVADGTVEGGLAWVANMVNRCNLVWIRDWGSKLVLADSSDKLICTTDNKGYFPSPPFNPPTYFLLDYIVPMLDELIGAGNYEYGHLVTTGVGGGWAALHSQKGTSDPNYEVIIHEIGHQIGSPHNLTLEDNPANAWSIGGTIMGSRSNTVLTRDSIMSGDQYSSHTIDIAVYGQRKSEKLFQHGWRHEASGNHLPVITDITSDDFTIPISTPFELEGNAQDPDGDPLTYTWEQNDRAKVSFAPPDFPEDNGPLFVSVFPSAKGNKRYFPNMFDLLKNKYSLKEKLPFSTRELNYRFIVRDNNPSCGSYVYKNVRLFSDANSGPFKVLTANNEEIFTAGTGAVIKWDVANTNIAPVNCKYVNIFLSTNNGRSFDSLLAENVDNDGEQQVTFPNIAGRQNRLMVKAADNIFFDVSDTPFTLHDPNTAGLFINIEHELLRVGSKDTAQIFISSKGLGAISSSLKISITQKPDGLTCTLNNSVTAVTVNSTSEDTLKISGLSKLKSGKYKIILSFISGAVKKKKEIILLKIGDVFTQAGKCVRLKKSSQQNIVLPPFNMAIQNFTFSCWVKTEGIQSAYAALFCVDGDSKAALNFKDNNELGYHWEGGEWSWNSGLTTEAGVWNHVALVVNNSRVTIYLNGEPSVEAVDAAEVNFTNNIRLGSYKNWSDRNYNGFIDEVSFWNKALSKNEIRQLMHSTLTGIEDGLISYYQFNSGKSIDAIGGNDGMPTSKLQYYVSNALVGKSSTSIKAEQPGTVRFDSARVSVNYFTQNGSDVVISRIASEPNTFAGLEENSVVLNEQYWVYHRYSEKGIYLADITFSVENLHSGANYDLPEYYTLYNRKINSEDEWKPIKNAVAGDKSLNTLTFEKVYQTGQFLIAKKDLATAITENSPVPEKFTLYQNYPNPFNPETKIVFDLPEKTTVRLEVYDILGNLIYTLLNEELSVGHYKLAWAGENDNGQKLASGLYIYRLVTDKFTASKKMLILR